MKPTYNKSTRFLAGLLFILVISLCGNALAAIAPEVATLEPIVDGLRTPLKMALDGDGSIYVADPRSGGVVVLNKYGVVVKNLPLAGSVSSVALLNANNSIPVPSGKAAGKVLAALGNYVAVLDENGEEVAKLGSGTGQFVKAAGMAVAPNGSIFVADAGARNVKIFSADGSFSFAIGSYQPPASTTTFNFTLPTAVAVISETAGTRIAVVDTIAGKVILLSPDGTCLGTIGSSGTGPLKFNYPVGAAFEYAGGALYRMYVVDMFQGEVQAIDPNALQFLTYVGKYGDKRGNLLTPSDLLFDPINKRLLVANGMSNIVSFGIDGGQNPVNSIPPALTIDQPVISVNVPSLVLTGTVDIGCTLAASVNTSARVSAPSFPSALSWMIPVDGLIPGVNVVSITAKNGYGTTITKTATIQYTPPHAVFSINSFDSLTSQPTITISGTVEPGSFIYVGNAATRKSGEADVSSSGSWSYALTLVEGINAIDVTAARSGASPSFKNIAITLDTQAPLLKVVAMLDGSSTANQVQNISGTVSDPNLSGVAVNGSPVAVLNGMFSYAVALVKGPNEIIVTAGDTLGHISSDTRTIIFDPDFPKISVTDPADGSLTNIQEVKISGSVDKVASVKVNGVVANPDGGLDWNASVKLAAGLNEIKIEATDLVGHVANVIRTIVYDAVAPNISINSPSQDVAVKSPGITIKGTVSDNTGIESISALVNDVNKQVMLADGEFSLFADFIDEGTYTIAVTVIDDAGNVTAVSRTVVYDVTPPVITVDTVSVAYPSVLTGTAEAGASIVVRDDAGISGRVTFAGQKWTADLTGLAYDPATLVAQATDAAGNVSVARINVPVPDGDVDGDGRVTIRDALTILRLVVSNNKPTDLQLAHGDIGPLLNGKINPKGKLEVVDAILILRKALGLLSW